MKARMHAKPPASRASQRQANQPAEVETGPGESVALVPIGGGGEIALSEPLQKQVVDTIRLAKATNTTKAYDSDWAHFAAWCAEKHLESLPASPGTVAGYLTDLANNLHYKMATVTRRASSISQKHQAIGLDTPTKDYWVRTTLQGLRRENLTAQKGKEPVYVEDIRRMVGKLPDSLKGKRDRALLLVGFCGAFRRSELAGLDVKDLEFVDRGSHDRGLKITLRRSKTDQSGEGRAVGIPVGSNVETCPVLAMRAWLEAAGIEDGPVFRWLNGRGHLPSVKELDRHLSARLSGHSIATVVKRACKAVGLDPKRYAGHSLRAGHVTQAAENRIPEQVIAQQTGHKSIATLRRYIRPATLFQDNSGGQLGL